MEHHGAKTMIALVAAVAALAAPGCGGNGGCLTPDQIQQQVDQIANGAETSDAQVQAKQSGIAAVRARQC